MKLQTYFLAVSMCIIAIQAQCAPILFNNAMSFDNNEFGLIDFDSTYQDTIGEINTYLQTYNASAVIYSGAILSGQSLHALPISGDRLLYSSEGKFKLTFNTPVSAVGAFLLGIGGTDNPYSGGIGCYITVWLANSGGTYQYNYTSLLQPANDRVTGFFGVFENGYGISAIEIHWNRDLAGIDNIYFSNTVTAGELLYNGPVNLPFSHIPSIPLPTEGIPNPPDPLVPEPATMLLFCIGSIVWLRKYLF